MTTQDALRVLVFLAGLVIMAVGIRAIGRDSVVAGYTIFVLGIFIALFGTRES